MLQPIDGRTEKVFCRGRRIDSIRFQADFQIGLPEDGGQMLLRHLHTQHREHRHRRLPPGKHARQVKSSQLSHVKKGQGK